MDIDDLVVGVDPQWRSELRKFIETGEGSERFLAFLDENSAAQAAVESAFSEQAKSFERLGQALRPEENDEQAVDARSRVEAAVHAGVIMAVGSVDELPPNERDEVVRKAAARLEPKSKRLLRALATE